MRFIDGHRARFGVEPICRVLTEHGCPIAPSACYAAKARLPSARALRDEQLKAAISRVHQDNYGVYGARKVSLALNREGTPVARCTVERLTLARLRQTILEILPEAEQGISYGVPAFRVGGRRSPGSRRSRII